MWRDRISMLIYHGRSTVSWKMMCLFTSIKAYCLLFYNNIWSSMNSMALLLLCMGEANAQTRIACSMAGREDGFVLESFGFPLPISNCKYAKTADGNPRKALPRMAVRYHAACILLLAILHVVLKQANAGQEVVQELMKQRQKSHENKPPSVKNMIKMKRKNGFLSRKRKNIVAKRKISIKTAKENGIRTKQANVRVPGGEKLALAHKKSGWCIIHNGKNKLKFKRKLSKGSA